LTTALPSNGSALVGQIRGSRKLRHRGWCATGVKLALELTGQAPGPARDSQSRPGSLCRESPLFPSPVFPVPRYGPFTAFVVFPKSPLPQQNQLFKLDLLYSRIPESAGQPGILKAEKKQMEPDTSAPTKSPEKPGRAAQAIHSLAADALESYDRTVSLQCPDQKFSSESLSKARTPIPKNGHPSLQVIEVEPNRDYPRWLRSSLSCETNPFPKSDTQLDPAPERHVGTAKTCASQSAKRAAPEGGQVVDNEVIRIPRRCSPLQSFDLSCPRKVAS
jgi:hypothetical protein